MRIVAGAPVMLDLTLQRFWYICMDGHNFENDQLDIHYINIAIMRCDIICLQHEQYFV